MPQIPPSQTFALIIGVNDYSWLDRSTGRAQGTSDLMGAQNDVRSVAMLVRMMDVPAENMRVLSNPLAEANDFAAVAVGREPVQNMNMASASFGYATKEGILAGLRWLAEKLQKNGSQGIVYFSGHSIVTRGGHPALCPADVHRAPSVRSVPDTDLGSYLRQSLLLSAVDEVVGGDPKVVLDFVQRFLAQPQRFDHPRAWAKECAEEQGIQPTEQGLARFMKYLGNHGAGIGSQGYQRRRNAADAIREAAGVPYTEEIVRSVLHGDPFTDADELRNLVSFNKAFVQCMRDVPEESQVHILLETCLKDEPGRVIHADYRNYGVPFAHGNIVLFASCALGQASNLAVFDNRWHGAFTWALVSLLGQTAVKVGAQRRSFDVSYSQLTERIQQLLGLMGFAQTPALWAQPAAARWEVLGGAPEQEVQLLAPVRVEEEISAGTGGSIFEARGIPGGTSLGWLIRTKEAFDAGGRSWPAEREFWVWKGADPIAASAEFKLVRPAVAPAPGAPLKDWVEVQGIPASASVTSCVSGAFEGQGLSPVPGGSWILTRNRQGLPPEHLAAVVRGQGTLRWHLLNTATTAGSRIVMSNPDQPAPAPGEEVIWARPPSPPPGVQAKGDVLIDQY